MSAAPPLSPAAAVRVSRPGREYDNYRGRIVEASQTPGYWWVSFDKANDGARPPALLSRYRQRSDAFVVKQFPAAQLTAYAE